MFSKRGTYYWDGKKEVEVTVLYFGLMMLHKISCIKIGAVKWPDDAYLIKQNTSVPIFMFIYLPTLWIAY